MRKIRSEKEIESRRKKMQLIVGIVMVGLLVLATAGYFAIDMFSGDSETSQNNIIQYGGRKYFTC